MRPVRHHDLGDAWPPVWPGARGRRAEPAKAWAGASEIAGLGVRPLRITLTSEMADLSPTEARWVARHLLEAAERVEKTATA